MDETVVEASTPVLKVRFAPYATVVGLGNAVVVVAIPLS